MCKSKSILLSDFLGWTKRIIWGDVTLKPKGSWRSRGHEEND